MTLANKLTISRFLMVLIILILAILHNLLAYVVFNTVTLCDLLILFVFVLASFTDYLDGKIARNRNQVTDLGKFLDPLADKLLVITTLVYLLECGRLVAFGISFGFILTLIVIREFIITGFRYIAVSKNLVISANILGKIKTLLQMIFVIWLLIGLYPFVGLGKDIVFVVVGGLVLIMTVWSCVDYIVKNIHILKKTEEVNE